MARQFPPLHLQPNAGERLRFTETRDGESVSIAEVVGSVYALLGRRSSGSRQDWRHGVR